MAGVNFTQHALNDLKEIGRYTKEEWGAAQARRYRQELELALQSLSLNPNIGRLREELAPDIRSFKVASHICFYLPHQAGLTVVRLLHPSQDIEQAFDRR